MKVVEMLILDKPTNTDPINLSNEWQTTPTSGQGLLLFAALDTASTTITITELSKKGAVGTSGGSAYLFYKETGADGVTEVTYSSTSDGFFIVLLIEEHDTTTLFDSFAEQSVSNYKLDFPVVTATATANTTIFQFVGLDSNLSLKTKTYVGTCRTLYEGTGNEVIATSIGLYQGFSGASGTTPGAGSVDLGANEGGGIMTVCIRSSGTIVIPTYAISQPAEIIERAAAVDIVDPSTTRVNAPLYKTIDTDLTFDAATDVNAGTNEITLTAHGFSKYDHIRYDKNGNTVISGLVDLENYTVNIVDDNTVTLRNINNGSNKSISTGTGTHVIRPILVGGLITTATINANRSSTTSHALAAFPTASSTDISGKIFYAVIKTLTQARLGLLENYGEMVVLVSTANNWVSYLTAGKDSIIDPGVERHIIIDPAENSHAIEIGTFDDTDLNYVGFANTRSSVNVSPTSTMLTMGTIDGALVVAGGQSSAPFTQSNLYRIASYGLVEVKGLDMIFMKSSLQLGNGAETIYFRSNPGAIEFIRSSDGIVDSTYVVSNIGIGLTIYASASCDIAINIPIIAGFFTVHASSSSSATYNFDAMLLSTVGDVTLRSFITITNIVFDGCRRIIDNDATISNSLVQNSSDTTGGILWTTTNNFSNVLFKDNTYAIEIDTAATYSFDNITFSGSVTKDLNVTAITGTVTINILNGGDTPTYDTAGATVTINNTVTIKVTCKDSLGSLVENARVRITKVIGGATVLEGLTDVNGILEDTGYDYTSPEDIEGYIRSGSSSPYYKQNDISGTITSNGFDAVFILVDDE